MKASSGNGRELETLPPLPMLEAALQKVQRLWTLPLVFPPELEERFESTGRQERINLFYLVMLISTALFEAFLILDYFSRRDLFLECVVVRVGVCMPLSLLCAYLATRVPSKVREMLFFAPGLLAGASVLYLYRGGVTQIAEGQLGMTVLMVGTFTMVRPRFQFACISVPIWGLGNLLFLLGNPEVNIATVASFCSLQWAAMGVSLLANYWMERSERTSFLLLQRSAHWNVELANHNTRLAQISILDPLTGIPNRRYFDAEFGVAWQTAQLTRQPLSVLMIDLDHFKRINDQHGHSYGDQVLTLAASTMRDMLRGDYDRVARYGGEEFVVFFPNCSLSKAKAIAERIRKAIETLQLPPSEHGDVEPLTVSIGIACMSANVSSGMELLRQADDAMYAAKNSGRNCVCVAA